MRYEDLQKTFEGVAPYIPPARVRSFSPLRKGEPPATPPAGTPLKKPKKPRQTNVPKKQIEEVTGAAQFPEQAGAFAPAPSAPAAFTKKELDMPGTSPRSGEEVSGQDVARKIMEQQANQQLYPTTGTTTTSFDPQIYSQLQGANQQVQQRAGAGTAPVSKPTSDVSMQAQGAPVAGGIAREAGGSAEVPDNERLQGASDDALIREGWGVEEPYRQALMKSPGFKYYKRAKTVQHFPHGEYVKNPIWEGVEDFEGLDKALKARDTDPVINQHDLQAIWGKATSHIRFEQAKVWI